MKLKVLRFNILLLILALLAPGFVYTSDDGEVYNDGIRSARKGNTNFAFMHFYSLLSQYPKSKFCEAALFGTGEYYFFVGDYSNAQNSFTELLNNYPQSKSRTFALAYLYKLALRDSNSALTERIKKEIIVAKRVSLLFRDYEENKYKSPMNRNYQARYYIDRVEIYRNEELFEKLSF